MEKSNKKCLYLTINILILMLMILNSCTSLKEIHNEKVEFVESIIQNPERCEEIIKSSIYYDHSLTKIGSTTCESLVRLCYNLPFNDIKIEVKEPKVKKQIDNELYIEIIDSDPRSRIFFCFYTDGINTNKLKMVGVVFL